MAGRPAAARPAPRLCARARGPRLRKRLFCAAALRSAKAGRGRLVGVKRVKRKPPEGRLVSRARTRRARRKTVTTFLRAKRILKPVSLRLVFWWFLKIKKSPSNLPKGDWWFCLKTTKNKSPEGSRFKHPLPLGPVFWWFLKFFGGFKSLKTLPKGGRFFGGF